MIPSVCVCVDELLMTSINPSTQRHRSVRGVVTDSLPSLSLARRILVEGVM